MRRRQRGIALIVVLWLTILLTVIGSGFAFSMRSEALSARNALSLAQVRAIADGAVERVAFELQRPRTLADVWVADGQPHAWTDGEVTIVARAVDESAKIDLNMAPEPLLKGLLTAVGRARRGRRPEARRCDRRLARSGRSASPQRCGRVRLPRGRPQLPAGQRARSKPWASCNACWE